MNPALTRLKLHSSSLVRVLADESLLDLAPADMVLAEQLALWVDFANAIQLSSLLNVPHTSGSAGKTQPASTLAQTVLQAHQNLRQTIIQGCVPKVFWAQLELLSPAPAVTGKTPAGFEPCRRYHAVLQRDIEATLQTLRQQAREALAQGPTALRKLALLDSTFEKILSERESKLLGTLPLKLEHRFKALQTDSETAAPERFIPLFQAVLLAELELRLQPILGLLEALQANPVSLP